MNVLMISDVYFPRINGVSTSIETFRAELHNLDTRSTLIAPAYPESEGTAHREVDSSDASVVRIPSRFLPMDPEDRMMRRSAIRQWMKEYSGPRFDLVHIQTPFVAHYAGLEIAQHWAIPAIASYHTYFEEYLYHYIPFLPREWLRAMARRFSRGQCNDLAALVVPSRAMADTLKAYGVHSPMHILPTGLPRHRYNGGDGEFFRSRYQIEAQRPVLLFVGRVAFEKNIGFLLEMLVKVRAAIPDILLIITGEGPALEELREQAATMGLSDNVRFLGYLDRRNELPDCYRAADLFVFASRTETQGLVLLEAMALGTPVVALAEMGTRDILEPANGAIIALNDVNDFAGKVCATLADREQLKHLGEAAQRDAHNWDAVSMAQRMQQLYANVCKGEASTPLPTAGSTEELLVDAAFPRAAAL